MEYMYLSHSIPADVRCTHNMDVMLCAHSLSTYIYASTLYTRIHLHARACTYTQTYSLIHARTLIRIRTRNKETLSPFFSGPFINVIHYRALVLSKRKTILRKKKKSNQKNIQNQICIMCINHEMVINCEKNASSNSETTWKKFREWKMNEKKWRQLWN